MHRFPKNPETRQKWTKFVRKRRKLVRRGLLERGLKRMHGMLYCKTCVECTTSLTYKSFQTQRVTNTRLNIVGRGVTYNSKLSAGRDRNGNDLGGIVLKMN